jgi:hypothetical protein
MGKASGNPLENHWATSSKISGQPPEKPSGNSPAKIPAKLNKQKASIELPTQLHDAFLSVFWVDLPAVLLAEINQQKLLEICANSSMQRSAT